MRKVEGLGVGDRLISSREAAGLLGVSPRTLDGWRSGRRPLDEQPPYYMRPGVAGGKHRIFYKLSEVRLWASQSLIQVA